MARRTPFERLVDDVRGRLESVTTPRSFTPGSVTPRPFATSTRGSNVGVDVAAGDDEYVVTVDVPGFDRGDVDVHLTGRTLTVEAERQSDSVAASDDDRYVQRQRRRTTTRERVTFPTDVRAADVSATLQNGVLTVELPKAETREASARADGE